jgi:hypothetical protein
MANQDKDKQGRSLDQQTRGGSSSIGTLGSGGTGRSETDKGYDEAANTPWTGNQQSAGRTDDLLSDGSDDDQNGSGFAGQGRPNDPTGLQTDAGNQASASIPGGDGNRQSGDLNQQSVQQGQQQDSQQSRQQGNQQSQQQPQQQDSQQSQQQSRQQGNQQSQQPGGPQGQRGDQSR